MTDCGLPPTPIHAGNGPDSVCGTTSWSRSDARVLPCQVTGPPCAMRLRRARPARTRFGAAIRRRRAARFEEAAGAQAAEPDGVVTNALDEFRDGGCRAWVVAGDAERAALRRARGPAFVFKFVVADVVEGLDDPRPGKPALDDLAAAVVAIFEHLLNAVDGRPVVHRVDDDLAGRWMYQRPSMAAPDSRTAAIRDGLSSSPNARNRYERRQSSDHLAGRARAGRRPRAVRRRRLRLAHRRPGPAPGLPELRLVTAARAGAALRPRRCACSGVHGAAAVGGAGGDARPRGRPDRPTRARGDLGGGCQRGHFPCRRRRRRLLRSPR